MKAERACAHDACLPCWGLSERPSVAWLSCASLSMRLCTSPRSHLHQEHSSPTVLPPCLQAQPRVTDSRGLHALRWPPGAAPSQSLRLTSPCGAREAQTQLRSRWGDHLWRCPLSLGPCCNDTECHIRPHGRLAPRTTRPSWPSETCWRTACEEQMGQVLLPLAGDAEGTRRAGGEDCSQQEA